MQSGVIRKKMKYTSVQTENGEMFTQVAAKASLEIYKKYKEGNRFVKTSNIIKQPKVIRLLPRN